MMMIIEKSSHKLFKVSNKLQLREVVKNGLLMAGHKGGVGGGGGGDSPLFCSEL